MICVSGARPAQPRQVDDGADGRMAGAEHGNGLAGIAARARGPARRACRRRCDPRARPRRRRRGRWRPPDWASTRCRRHRSRRRRAASRGPCRSGSGSRRAPSRGRLVLTLSKPARAMAITRALVRMCCAEPGAGGQRLEVVLDQLAAGRVVLGIGAVPAGLRQQPLGRLVDIVAPGREHAHVRPLPHRMSGLVARLQHDRLAARARARARPRPVRSGPAPMIATVLRRSHFIASF